MRGKKRRPAKVATALVALALMIAVEAFGQIAGDFESFHTRVLLVAPVPFICYCVWRFHLNPYLAFHDSHIRVGNVFSDYVIPYRSIVECSGRLSLILAVDGWGRLPVSAFDASFVGRRQRDEIVAEIHRRRESAQNDFSVRFSKVHTYGIPEAIGIGSTLILFLLSI